MKTNFFTSLLGSGIEHVVLEIKKPSEGPVTVCVTPKSTAKDAAFKLMKPLLFTDTPEALDEGFLEAIQQPLATTQQSFNNIKAFEAQKAEADKSTSAAKESKDKIKNAVEALKKVYDSKDFKIEKDKVKTLNLADAVLKIDCFNSYATKVKKEIEDKSQATGGLFGMLQPEMESLSDPEIPIEQETSDEPEESEENETENEQE